MSDVDVDPITRQVVQQAQLISQLRRDLDRLASEVTDTYADVISRFDDANSDNTRAGAPTAWSWRSIGPRAAEELRSQLGEWVAWLRHRYPLAKKIPECWSDHPELVEELTALWLAWQAAYEQRDAALTAPADWHDRWLPGVLHRLEHGTFAVSCSSEHQARPARCYAAPR